MYHENLTPTQKEIIEALENGDLIVRWNSHDDCQINGKKLPKHSHWILRSSGERVYESTLKSLVKKGIIKFFSYNDNYRTGIREDHYSLQNHSLFGKITPKPLNP